MKQREPSFFDAIHTRPRRSRPLPTHRMLPENAAIGTAVIYRAHPGAEPIQTRTRSKPWRLPHGAVVVLVEGRVGGVALWALEVVETQIDLFGGKR